MTIRLPPLIYPAPHQMALIALLAAIPIPRGGEWWEIAGTYFVAEAVILSLVVLVLNGQTQGAAEVEADDRKESVMMKRIAIVVVLMFVGTAIAGDAPDIDRMTAKQLRELAKAQQQRIVDLEAENAVLRDQLKKAGVSGAPKQTPTNAKAIATIRTVVADSSTSPVKFELVLAKPTSQSATGQNSTQFEITLRVINTHGKALRRCNIMMNYSDEKVPIQMPRSGEEVDFNAYGFEIKNLGIGETRDITFTWTLAIKQFVPDRCKAIVRSAMSEI